MLPLDYIVRIAVIQKSKIYQLFGANHNSGRLMCSETKIYLPSRAILRPNMRLCSQQQVTQL